MKVFAALLLCFLALKTSSQHIQAEDEQHREKRWSLTDIKLPSLDVSLLAFSLNIFKNDLGLTGEFDYSS